MLYRALITLAIAAITSPMMGQGVQWGVGTDPTMWLSGWHHVQVGAQLHPELSLVGGAGWMQAQGGLLGSAMNQRPANFDEAFSGNFGVRLHPSPKEGGRIQGLLGLDYSFEVFNENVTIAPEADAGAPFGLRQYSRNELRLLAGGRIKVADRMSLSVHMGVGYSTNAEALPIQTNLGRRAGARLLGMELLFWI